MIKRVLLTLAIFCFMTGVALAAVNINTAPPDQLQTLSGIGPAKAAAIVEYREKNGEFSSIQDLAKVPGIGPRTLESLSDSITIKE